MPSIQHQVPPLNGAPFAESPAGAMRLFNFHGDELALIHDERGLWVVVKRVCEALGIAEQRQAAKLKDKAWATTTIMVAVAEDGKPREMFCIHLDSLPMWLATLDASRVSATARPKIERYQVECARVLRAHFLGQPAPRQPPSVDVAQARIAAREEAIARVLFAYGALLDPTWVRKNAAHAVAVLRGTEPENDVPRLLDVSTYLTERGLSASEVRAAASTFGKRVKRLYIEAHGRDPGRCLRMVNGSEREVASYTDDDRPLFDAAFDAMGAAPRLPAA